MHRPNKVTTVMTRGDNATVNSQHKLTSKFTEL